MPFLKRLFNFYINASIHVSLAVCALVGVTVLSYGLRLPLAFWGFVFFGTVTGYNFVKYAKVAGLHHRSLAESLRAIQVFSFLSFALLLVFCLFLPFKTLVVTAGFALLTVFYAVPLFQTKNLRSQFGIKLFIVAMVWAGVTVIVPVIASGDSVSASQWLTFAQRFLFVIVLTLPFEIRDLRYDAPTLGTLPQRLGVRRVKMFGLCLLATAIVLEFFKGEPYLMHLLSLTIICLLLSTVLVSVKREQAKYFASFWVEGIPLVWLAALWVLSQFFL